MNDDGNLQRRADGTILHRPAQQGGLESAHGARLDYRDRLRSRRWNAAPLENPEAEPTDPRIAVAAIAVLSVITFVVIALGYGSRFWS